MRTRYGVSPWIHGFPDSRRPVYPRLRGDLTASVVIIGGGLTGCATAYACAVAGMRPIIIEADRIGTGSSGRSVGLLLSDPGPSFRDVVAAHGLRAGRKIFDAWRRAALDAAALTRRLGIKAGLDSANDVTVAFGDDKLLRREVDARQAASVEAHWLSQRQVRGLTQLEASAALRVGGAFTVDPYRMCLGLAAAAIARGATVAERTAVKKVRAGRKDVEIAFEGGTIRAGRIIVTTGIATPLFTPLRRHFDRRHRYVVMTEPLPAAMRKQLAGTGLTLRNAASPPHRLRWTRDDRLVIAGADQSEIAARARDAALVQRTGQLMYEVLRMYPAISGLTPEFGWDLAYGDTADGLPYIGPHRNYPHHLFALGGRGDSMTGAFLAARILARAAADAPDKGDEVFGWTR